MGTGIFRFELEGTVVLGFDTGLDAQAFAQAKMAQFINQKGYIVFPPGQGEPWDGKEARVEPWKPQGVTERPGPGGSPGTMVVWGADFPGEALDRIIGEDQNKDTALDALRYWIRARSLLADTPELSPPWPAGALVALPGAFPPGTILFPPARLLRRTVEAPGPAEWLSRAERWVHPDLSGGETTAFTAAALAYQLFCGVPPYENQDTETVHEDIREGNFMPPRLRKPGLREDLALLIAETLGPAAGQRRGKTGPIQKKDPGALGTLLGPPGFAPFDSWIRPPDDGALEKLAAEREQYRKKNDLSVKSRRFVRRNTTILTAGLVALVIIGLVARSIVRGRADLPTTKGMAPTEVIEAYYGAFGTLDHTLMEACVINKAGKGDISLVTNIFVISKVRQAYEMNITAIDAREWQAAGSPPTEQTVVGVTDLHLVPLDSDPEDGELTYRASGFLWLPAGMSSEEAGEETPPDPAAAPAVAPGGYAFTDELRLVWHKDAWRIAELTRQ
ncbi:MAG: hypothetical protein LBQ38_08470 [Spirochaetaceae bacterium]|jgi:hypothetical protein|nr:hypothetical protein [Spirochaetaceae bacterium]